MTSPKLGDRVSGTIEGRIEAYRGREYVSVRGGEDAVWLDHVKNVEVLAEQIVLPTKPGSFIIANPEGARPFLYRLDDGEWCESVKGNAVHPAALIDVMSELGYRIIEAVES